MRLDIIKSHIVAADSSSDALVAVVKPALEKAASIARASRAKAKGGHFEDYWVSRREVIKDLLFTATEFEGEGLLVDDYGNPMFFVTHRCDGFYQVDEINPESGQC